MDRISWNMKVAIVVTLQHSVCDKKRGGGGGGGVKGIRQYTRINTQSQETHTCVRACAHSHMHMTTHACLF